MKKYRPEWLIIELGGNDGLRGLSLPQTESNIRQMVQLGNSQQSCVLLLGMMLPPNFGKAFTQKFLHLYQSVSLQMKLPLVPFFLEGVADQANSMQRDGIHPNAKGQPVMLRNVWRVLEPLLKNTAESSG